MKHARDQRHQLLRVPNTRAQAFALDSGGLVTCPRIRDRSTGGAKQLGPDQGAGNSGNLVDLSGREECAGVSSKADG